MTTTFKFPHPVESDCVPYYFRYINKVPEGDIITQLEAQLKSCGDFISGLTPAQLQFSYAPGKWTLAEMIGHILDTERVFAYRLMCISRGETKSLPGFEQDDYVANSIYNQVPGSDLAAEWSGLRDATIWLCKNMTHEMAIRMGTANDKPVRASAYPYIMVGHVIHHMEVAAEKYLH
ncbi:MAG TPA: DinB family protein [Saprospiraceae bacterium]|nr:DinB family protein [Saprospiraceae bacterium]